MKRLATLLGALLLGACGPKIDCQGIKPIVGKPYTIGPYDRMVESTTEFEKYYRPSSETCQTGTMFITVKNGNVVAVWFYQ